MELTILYGGAGAAVYIVIFLILSVHQRILDGHRTQGGGSVSQDHPLFRGVGTYIAAFATYAQTGYRKLDARLAGVGDVGALTGPERMLISIRSSLKHKLNLSGKSMDLSVYELMGMIVACLAGGLLIGHLMAFAVKIWLVAPVVTVLLGLMPLSWLSEGRKKRLTGMQTDLPFVLDMLALGVESGLDFLEAMRWVARESKGGPLAKEFDFTVKEISMGKSRKQALKDLSERSAMPELSGVVAALIRADQLGSGLASTLREQVKQLRARRVVVIEERSNKAASRLMLPMLLVFFGVAIFVAAPFVLPLMDQVRGVF